MLSEKQTRTFVNDTYLKYVAVPDRASKFDVRTYFLPCHIIIKAHKRGVSARNRQFDRTHERSCDEIPGCQRSLTCRVGIVSSLQETAIAS